MRAAVVVLLWLVFIGRAGAIERAARIALLTGPGDGATGPLFDELSALGFDVVNIPIPQGPLPPDRLAAAARESDALAALRLTTSDRGVEVWLADRVTGKVVLREIVRPADGSALGTRVVVLRAVELLRASLMEMDAPHVSKGEVAAPATLREVVGLPAPQPRSPRVSIAVGPGLLLGQDAVGMLGGASLGVHVGLLWRLAVGISAFMPLSSSSLQESEGDASVDLVPVAATLRLSLTQPTSRWQPWLEAGGGPAWMRVRSAPASGYEPGERLSLLGWVTGTAGLGLRLSPRVRVSGAATLGWLPARPIVRFDEREVAGLGPLFVLACVAVEVGL